MKKPELKALLVEAGWVAIVQTPDLLQKRCQQGKELRQCRIFFSRSFCEFRVLSERTQEWFTLGRGYYKDLKVVDNVLHIGTVKVQVGANAGN